MPGMQIKDHIFTIFSEKYTLMARKSGKKMKARLPCLLELCIDREKLVGSVVELLHGSKGDSVTGNI
jgi:hypothetical protein